MSTYRHQYLVREPNLGPHLTLACADYGRTGHADVRRARLADAALHATAARWASIERPDDAAANDSGGWN